MVNQLTKLYQHDRSTYKHAEGDYLRQHHDHQKELATQLVKAVERLSERLSEQSASPLPNETNDAQTQVINPQTATDDDRNLPLSAHDTVSQALTEAIRPIVALLEDKLAQKLMLDASTEQSGRQIVTNLERLNQIMDEFE